MRTCERLVKEGRFVPSNPVGILTAGYCELLQNKVPLLGKRAKIYKVDLCCMLSRTYTQSRLLKSVISFYIKFTGSYLNQKT